MLSTSIKPLIRSLILVLILAFSSLTFGQGNECNEYDGCYEGNICEEYNGCYEQKYEPTIENTTREEGPSELGFQLLVNEQLQAENQRLINCLLYDLCY